MSSSNSENFTVVGIDVGGKNNTIACTVTGSGQTATVTFANIRAVEKFEIANGAVNVENSRRIIVIDAPLTYNSGNETGARHLERDNVGNTPGYNSIHEYRRVIMPNSFRGIGRAVALGKKFKDNYTIAETHPGAALYQLIKSVNAEGTILTAWESYKGTKSTKQVRVENTIFLAKWLISEFASTFRFVTKHGEFVGEDLANASLVLTDVFKSDDFLDAFVCALVGLAKIGGITEVKRLTDLLRDESWHSEQEERKYVNLIWPEPNNLGLYLDLGKKMKLVA